MLRSAAAKKVVGEALSGDIADLTKVNKDTANKKNRSKGAGKGHPKKKGTKDDELKNMQKTIKQLLNLIYYSFFILQ